MPKEKGDLPEFPVEHRPNETGAVEVKFGGTAASLFGRILRDWLNCSHLLFSTCRLRYLRCVNWGGWQDLNRSCAAGLCLNSYTQLSGQVRGDNVSLFT